MESLSRKAIIRFTDNAFTEITRLKEKEDFNKYLRVGVKNGGCSGFSYIFEFDVKKDGDLLFNYENLEFIVDSTHVDYLNNLEVDYEQGLNNRGFTFKNPNASTTCGCGTSFA